jgi:CRISPR-associated protein Cmr2
MRQACNELESAGARLILPAPGSQGMPNRVVAEINDEVAAATASRAVTAAQHWWAGQAVRVLGAADERKSPAPQMMWALGSGDTYKQAWDEAHRLLDGRKRARSFAPRFEAAHVLCQLSGRDPALTKAPAGIWNPRNERLSAEGWLKRRFQVGGFPSTRSVATAHYRAAIIDALAANDPTVTAAVEELIQACAALSDPGTSGYETLDARATMVGRSGLHKLDGQWLLPGVWQDKRLVEEQGVDKAAAAEATQRGTLAAVALRKAMAERDVATPPSHLAVIMQDVDRLGATLGHVLTDTTGPEVHRAIAEAIARCAVAQRDMIESDQFLGRVVYAGGDDLVALAPAATALQIAQQARAHIDQHLVVNGKPMTASTGVVYFPADYPLQLALRRARTALDDAKQAGRDCVTIVVLNGGGERDSLTATWTGAGGINAVERVRRLVHTPIAGARLSSRLHLIAPAIDDLAVLARELRRILSRTEGLDEATAEQVAVDLDALTCEPNRAEATRLGSKARAQVNELETAAHLIDALEGLGVR